MLMMSAGMFTNDNFLMRSESGFNGIARAALSLFAVRPFPELA